MCCENLSNFYVKMFKLCLEVVNDMIKTSIVGGHKVKSQGHCDLFKVKHVNLICAARTQLFFIVLGSNFV